MYEYKSVRPRLFTDEGQRNLLKVRDRVQAMLKDAGAFRMDRAWTVLGGGDIWEFLAYVDRLVEMGEIREITGQVAGQHRVFVSATETW